MARQAGIGMVLCRSFSISAAAGNLCDKIGFIGAGNMAKAIMGGMIRNGVQRAHNVMVYDVSTDQMDACCKAFPGIRKAESLHNLLMDADIVLLGVKPQNVEAVLKPLKAEVEKMGPLRTDTVLASIIAGVPLHAFQKYTGMENIVRAMPNTPVTVEQGCTVWCSTRDLPKEKKELISKLFSAIGDEIYMEDERFLDMATAISGSGPAYVFLTMEAMIDSGVHMGFPRHIAERLVMNTLLGTCLYAIQSGEHVSKLRNDITSPGGTTASAIYNLEKGGFRTTVSDAVWAAYRRSLELGGMDSNVGPGRNNTLPTFWQKDMRDDTA
ncbi:hypothetical protein GUITHDRAFT_155130 [Guillardia theta CCMP2712]|uniref:Pyrroline-5-carboxylate reductase n=2 Tax=Geminigeraceae TaxID=589343 RepID=L1IM23_GUITC|nr:hypothetical protein GUITHDRAFT_155130 [Guillardia theta CCMP2712]EKX36840.1 hypothetical protein GUITHDRAFT_155130 [Guillardia theta CCMP2712]|eukprot:XP_005823820.1 hypothetical protein GUITHDRAFT_155130 [Guillardia theta CCMP2712]